MARCNDHRHFRAKRLGELQCGCADSARGAVNQDFLTGFQPQCLQRAVGVERAFAEHRFSKWQIRRHERDIGGFRHASVFRVRSLLTPALYAEHRIARFEADHARPDRLDLSGEIHAKDRVLRPVETCEGAHDEGMRTHEAAISTVHRRRTNFHQHFAGLRRWFGDIPDFDHTIAGTKRGLHVVDSPAAGLAQLVAMSQRVRLLPPATHAKRSPCPPPRPLQEPWSLPKNSAYRATSTS